MCRCSAGRVSTPCGPRGLTSVSGGAGYRAGVERVGLAPGAEVGGYTILAPLGSGGMGTVYRAADGGGTPVALKLLHPHVGADPEARQRLRREVVALQRLHHPGVAAVLDAEADSSEAFLVTELVGGRDLAEHVRTRGPLSAAELFRTADALADALHAVHQAGVVHRDLKPSNVVMGPDGPVLIDFGIAQPVDETRLTSTGLVVGSPGYLAPELIDGAEPTPGTDWWGWAAVLAYTATGRAPFGVRPLASVLERTRAGRADLSGLGPVTAEALAAALSTDPAGRPSPGQTLEALAEAERRGERFDPAAVTVPLGAVAAAGAATAAGVGGAGAAAATTAPATSVLPSSAADDGTSVLPADGAGRPGTPTGATAVLGAATPAAPDATRAMPVVGPGEGLTGATTVVPAVDPTVASPTTVYPPAVDGPVPQQAPGTWSAYPTQRTEGYPGYPGDGSMPWDQPEELPPPPPRRHGTVLALGLLAVAAAAWRPGATVLIVAVLLLLARTVGSVTEAVSRRRARTGVRRSDGLRAVLSSPWHLLRALVSGLPSSLLAAAAVAGTVAGGGWLLQRTGVEGGWATTSTLASPATSALLAVAMTAGLLLLWWGPGARTTREGTHRTLAALTGRPVLTVVVVLAVLAATGWVVWRLASGDPVEPGPLPGAVLPDIR